MLKFCPSSQALKLAIGAIIASFMRLCNKSCRKNSIILTFLGGEIFKTLIFKLNHDLKQKHDPNHRILQSLQNPIKDFAKNFFKGIAILKH